MSNSADLSGTRLTVLAAVMEDVRRSHELYPVFSRYTWHARHVQRQRPTQRGLLTGR
jgi:hypothetical protein